MNILSRGSVINCAGKRPFDRHLPSDRRDHSTSARAAPDEETSHSALQQAADAAGGLDIRLGGGSATIRQYLRAALIDELHLPIAPVLLGTGEHLLSGIDLKALGYECVKHIAGTRATHIILRKRL